MVHPAGNPVAGSGGPAYCCCWTTGAGAWNISWAPPYMEFATMSFAGTMVVLQSSTSLLLPPRVNMRPIRRATMRMPIPAKIRSIGIDSDVSVSVVPDAASVGQSERGSAHASSSCSSTSARAASSSVVSSVDSAMLPIIDALVA